MAKKEEREEVKRIMAEKRKVAENLMYAFVLLAATISLVLFFVGYIASGCVGMILVVVYLVASQSRVALVDVNDTVEVILEKLQRYKLDDSTQRQGVEALFRLTRISDIKARSFNIDVIATKGIATVVQASILYPEDPEILARVLGVLSNISFDPKIARSAVSKETVKWCLESFEEHLNHRLTCKYAYLLISAVANADINLRDDAIRYGAMKLIASSMKHFSGDAELSKYGCMTLLHLCMQCERAQAKVRNQSVLLTVTTAMRNHIDEKDVQQLGIGVIGACVLPAEENVNLSYADECGSFEAVQNAMIAFPDVLKIRQVGAKILNARKSCSVHEMGDEEEDYVLDFAEGLRKRH